MQRSGAEGWELPQLFGENLRQREAEIAHRLAAARQLEQDLLAATARVRAAEEAAEVARQRLLESESTHSSTPSAAAEFAAAELDVEPAAVQEQPMPARGSACWSGSVGDADAHADARRGSGNLHRTA
eukprot:6196234-Pleurochrysis_carterae.AAC.1